ncbi:cyclophilin-like domain-containing protein [Pavlovales sp. CCMP2436]|nr:cyclophilin-like domain-containing protein [Pavlovales sp. CCMP2436]
MVLQRGIGQPRTMLRLPAALLCLLAALAAARAQAGCEDENANCSEWAAGGECDKNRDFMRSTCAKSCNSCSAPIDERLFELGDERVHMTVEKHGMLTLGFYPNAAPATVKHIVELFRLGCYDTNHIFRVDRGFVAQVQSVYQGAVRNTLSPECLALSAKTVPGEFTDIPHVKGTLSMGRMADPDSGGSSFSMLLGKAPHLDHQYTVFGRILEGLDVLESLEHVETTRQGIFVMPKERIEISTAIVVDKDARTEL